MRIRDEAERRVVLSAIWRRTASEIGERFYDRLTDEAEAALEPQEDDPAGLLVTREATLLYATLLNVEKVREAPFGTDVSVSMSADELRRALDGVAAGITEDERLWLHSHARRERLLANYDAAVRLRDELATPGAVA
jgi:hypothetical protein